ncbi:putative transporter [Aspergillus homomorphus CBS 101889]|uniref:Putative transporter n=1 Tax=Aspergillus homomorphus (strain CBS 101889) TaxID=1450537 RepID=A0A395HP28_ASPHC|nr:putative transporter [Aspergillus homomorphus CBS 101889]RAL08024.1 putative transporter [Aspergillus homomorphus CBS 101889]
MATSSNDKDTKLEPSETSPSVQAVSVLDQEQSPNNNENVHKRPRFRLTFAALSMMAMLVSFEGAAMSVALPTIADSLNGTAIESFWFGTAYLLCATTFQPIFASLSDAFGRRKLVLTGILFFLVGTIVGSVSTSASTMLVGRSLQGIGAGGMFTLVGVVITDVVPLRERGLYFGIVAALVGFGAVAGPLAGGGFAESVTWRWIFYINFPFIALSALSFLLFMADQRPAGVREKAQSEQIDLCGILLLIGSITSFLLGLTWGGVNYPWKSYQTILPLVLGALGLTVFGAYEHYWAKSPIVPPQLFRNRTTVICYICVAIKGLVLFAVLYCLPIYFQAVKGYSPVHAGLALLPLLFSTGPAAVVTGLLINKVGHYRWAIWTGFPLLTTGIGLFCLLHRDTAVAAWVVILIVLGLGIGILFCSLLFGVQASVNPAHITMAVGMTSCMRCFGQALGVALGGVIIQNHMRHVLFADPALAARADDYSRDTVGLVQSIPSIPDVRLRHEVQDAYTESLRIFWEVCCALGGVGLLLSLLIRSYRLTSYGQEA